MAGNSFGRFFRITTWGESHGLALGVIVDGCPAGLEISPEDIQYELDRRRPGQSRITTQRKEADAIEILSGVFEGKTLGTPISMMVRNTDVISKSYEDIKDVYRPGHADFTYDEKYGHRDHRGGGRSSARETVGRVAAAAIAKKILNSQGVRTTGYVKQVGDIVAQDIDFDQIEENPVRCPDPKAAEKMIGLIESVRKEGDSVGGTVEVVSQGLPSGLGDPVFNKLDADLARALMSIGGIRGFEVGMGFGVVEKKGSQVNDLMYKNEDGTLGFRTNNSGGLLGGITSGADLVVRIAIKPTSSISQVQDTVDKRGEKTQLQVKGRHDPCLCPRAVPIAEAMVNLVLVDHLLISKLSTI
ncbi:MAG: chorismate synthase [Candidatus Dadabacteria bacterium]|nr:chorismate synthase [Candidatus Dadabacteria bacterium]MYA48472.1 chorismate synthase [Candidatus Dadabacteria bacterium]MYG82954.1 chorismate synthase [Candidatus Dadabacteria bacterium]MYK49954.1 chorismate synthase [Candidatus Dadabacteria bacterium]